MVHGQVGELEGLVGPHSADPAFLQVKRCTTTRPKLQAGREFYLIARDLMGIETLHQAGLWVERYLDWCGFWADFLEDRTVVAAGGPAPTRG